METGDEVLLGRETRTVRAPVLVAPGHADDAVTVALGYGRDGAGPIARGVGFFAGALRTTSAPWFASDLRLRRLGTRIELAISQEHTSPHGRKAARSITARSTPTRNDPDSPAEERARDPSPRCSPPVEPAERNGPWSIDMTACTGCSACVVACQSENNVALVGKENVSLGREMYWLRIDTYFEGPAEEPSAIHQPMACQHCEKAPCEYVCPVNATVHSPDGLNEMVYNRCVGTRFCSNNCPYKVRRFNWFNWNHHQPGEPRHHRAFPQPRGHRARSRRHGEMLVLRAAHPHGGDPRSGGRPAPPRRRGRERLHASVSDARHLVRIDHHPSSEVARWRGQPRSYGVLHELGTEPRTQYLARVM